MMNALRAAPGHASQALEHVPAAMREKLTPLLAPDNKSSGFNALVARGEGDKIHPPKKQQTKHIELENGAPGSQPTKDQKTLLIEMARRYPEIVFYLHSNAARAIPLSLFAENAEHFKTLAGAHTKASAESADKAKAAFEALAKKEDITGAFDPKHFIDEHGALSDAWKNHSAFQSKKTEGSVLTGVENIQQHLKEAHLSKQRAAVASDHEFVNRLMVDTKKHPAYRALARTVSANARKQMFDWINIIGLLTMIATMPLMYEGLKQWVQQMGHKQNG